MRERKDEEFKHASTLKLQPHIALHYHCNHASSQPLQTPATAKTQND